MKIEEKPIDTIQQINAKYSTVLRTSGSHCLISIKEDGFTVRLLSIMTLYMFSVVIQDIKVPSTPLKDGLLDSRLGQLLKPPVIQCRKPGTLKVFNSMTSSFLFLEEIVVMKASSSILKATILGRQIIWLLKWRCKILLSHFMTSTRKQFILLQQNYKFKNLTKI